MAKAKKLRLSGAMKARLSGNIRQGRRETVYRMLKKRHGMVPCFVCERNVEERHATLEHIIPYAEGGTDDMDNLSISHNNCNQRRGCIPADSQEFLAVRAEMVLKNRKHPFKAEFSNQHPAGQC